MTGDDDAAPPPEPALELADVGPRRQPAAPSTAPPGDRAPFQRTALAGGTALPEAEAPPARFGLVHVALVAVAVGVIALGVVIYRRATRPDVVAIKSPYRSYVGLTFELPSGGGWKTDRRLRQNRQQGPAWMRIETLFRGASAIDPDDLLLAFRVHAEGAFAAQVDLEQLRRQAQQISDQVAASGSMNGGTLQCTADKTLRTEPAALCRGRGIINGLAITLGVYVWQPTTEDVVGLFYASVAPDTSEFEAVVRSAE